MRKLLLPIVAALLAVWSCSSDLDPFEGTDGIRFNLNGIKYVMQDGFMSPIPLEVTETGVVINASMSGSSLLDVASITINLCPLDQLAVDTEYKTGENGISAELLLYFSGMPDIWTALSSKPEEPAAEAQPQEDPQPIPLEGWVKRVASETEKLELLFEFSGKDPEGNQYELKHGFLRL